MARRTNRPSWRLLLLFLVLLVSAGGIVARLVQVQILDRDYYAERADETHLRQTVIRAPRGAILDRNGYPLALTVTTFDVYIDPRNWEDDAAALRAASALGPLLDRDPAELIAATRAQTRGDYLASRSVSSEVGLQIREQALAGVRTLDTGARFYPEGDLASALLGFIGRDQIGLEGIEAAFESELGGSKRTVILERDGLGNRIPFGDGMGARPVAGGDVYLTIDRYIQSLVEDALDAALEAHEASGGTIIVMDPGTGEILAMASRPSFRLTELDLDVAIPATLFRNRAVTDSYAPGSVMKTITVAAAIDLGLVTPQSTYVDTGFASIQGGHQIRNWDLSANGTISVTGVLQKSLNTGAVWMAGLLGPDRFYQYVQRFGFGETTQIKLGGEASGLVRTNEDPGWFPGDLATNSFGQGIAVTPLQMLTAISALVNGGLLMQPYIVGEVAGPERRRVFEPVVVRRVISEETSRALARMMNAVVDAPGRNHPAAVFGYRVGGKTGTSTFTDRDTTITSFVGFVPVQEPAFAMLVKIDEPQDSRLGSVVAAPIFAELAPQILTYLGVRPDDVAHVASP